jgi:uncharacterized protein YoxC
MEFLTQLFGNLTSGIIRLGVAVGILAAVYFLILRPILDTTDNAVNSANQAFEKSFDGSPVDTKAIEAKVNKTIEDVNRQVQVEVKRSFHVAKVHGNPNKIVRCIQRSNGNVHKIERCAQKY